MQSRSKEKRIIGSLLFARQKTFLFYDPNDSQGGEEAHHALSITDQFPPKLLGSNRGAGQFRGVLLKVAE